MEKQELLKKSESISTEIRRQKRESLITNKRAKNAETEMVETTKVTRGWEKRTYTMRDFDKLEEMIRSHDPDKVLEGTFGMKKLLVNPHNTSIKRVFVGLLSQNQFEDIKREAMTCLINITTAEGEECKQVIEEGGLEAAVALLQVPQGNLDLRYEAIWMISNLCADNVVVRDKILELGMVGQVVLLLTQTKIASKIDTLLWALANICRGSPPPAFERVKDALPIFIQTLKTLEIDNQRVITEVVWALSYVVQSSTQSNKSVIEGGLVPKLGQFLRSPVLGIVMPSIRIIGNLFSVQKEEQLAAFHPFIYEPLFAFVNHTRKAIRREALWAITNIAAGTKEMVRIVCSYEMLLSKVIEMFNNDFEDIKREAAWFFSNIAEIEATTSTARLFGHYNVMAAFSSNIKNSYDSLLLLELLETLSRILAVGDSLKKEMGQNPFLSMFNGCEGQSALSSINPGCNQVWEMMMAIEKKYYQPHE